MYSFSPKLKLYSIIFIIAGLALFGVGYAVNHSMSSEQIEHRMEQKVMHYEDGTPVHSNSAEAAGPQDHNAHLEHAERQVHNEPLSALLVAAMFFFGISACALFFLCIQNVAHAGWPVIISRVMEAAASYIPIGGVILLVIVLLNVFHCGHLYHWMDSELTNPTSSHFDIILYEKSKFLNPDFYLFRSFVYVIGATYFMLWVRHLSKKLDENKNLKTYKKLYNWSVGYIAFFALASAAWAWDWLMSIDPHWYSTLFIWYTMVSCLASAVAVIILVSVYLKKNGFLPQFNNNHLHDLGVYLFATSMLWSYLWFSQFMLYWYANIPEEIRYFFDRHAYYKPVLWVMLVMNFLIPILVMVSSSIKRNYVVMTTMAVIVILGHWLDYFNIVMPGTVGPYWAGVENILMTLGSFLFIVGLFVFVIFTMMGKRKLIPTGNPLLKESEIYEYPF